MPMSAGDRVTLVRDGRQVGGTVKSIVDADTVYVQLDSGSACSLRVTNLVPEAKAWPPRLETK